MKKTILLQTLFTMLLGYQVAYADAILLNEYNAVAPDNVLKNGGYDLYFGEINGNGGSWLELAITEDDLDIRGARIEIEKSGGTHVLTANFPDLVEFSALKKGTLITVSELPTDLSYAPLDEENPDWSINLNGNEFININGQFEVTAQKMDISIYMDTPTPLVLMQNSGEIVKGWGISNNEIFKLKKDSSADITPDDPAYGDDAGKQIISTFGVANRWIDSTGSTIYQDLGRPITDEENPVKIILNEYNAVASTQLLKKDGNDTHFGKIYGNGDDWLELVVVEDNYDLRGAKIEITNSAMPTFKASFPELSELSALKKGTIVTLSFLDTDLSYAPLDPSTLDWNINLNISDLNVSEGEFIVSNSKTTISMFSKDYDAIMPQTGEGIFGGGIDDKEVFKLRRRPSSTVDATDEDTYGDDQGKPALSTFGQPNHWMNTLGELINQSFAGLRYPETDTSLAEPNFSLVLNEYSAVAPNQLLKDGGTDTHFGAIEGNGGAWLELIVTKGCLNLQGALIKIRQNSGDYFEAKLPHLLQLAYLREGTMITISTLPTSMEYAPFAPNGEGWKLNINSEELTDKLGTFNFSDKAVKVSIFSEDRASILLSESGEGVLSSDTVDNQEVFKLKTEPNLTITPTNSAYGDDSDMEAISTFSFPNKWIDSNGTLTEQSFTLRENMDLNETGGIVLSNLGDFRDTESLLYIPINNSLWVADDSAHKVYEVDLTSHEIKSTFTDADLGGFTNGEIQESCHDRAGVCDIESLAYDESSDTLYIFAGSVASTPSVFKLTRGSTSEPFTINDFRKLDNEYPAVQFIEGEFVVSIDDRLYPYDFEENQADTSNLLYEINSGKVHGMAYANNTLWITTSTAELKKIQWESKVEEASYDMQQNGVYDPRGIEVINNQLYILEGINCLSKYGESIAPFGHALKNAVHIYQLP